MKLYSTREAAEKLNKHYTTLINWIDTNYLVPDVNKKGIWYFTEKRLNDYLNDKERKTIDKKLVILSLNEEISEANLALLKRKFINNSDDKYELREIFGVADEELLSNKDFKKLLRELVGHYIYRLVVFKSDFKERSDAFDYLKIACEETRTSLKFIEGEEVEEENVNEELNI